jgi:glucose-1-phosphate cytidylyltransferase
MKVVLFCGGQGIRLRELSDTIPKPMAAIGQRPILWHEMRYYSHFGHRDFILCLGHKATVIKDYFLHYDETVSNDFVLSDGGRAVELLSTDASDWRVTFAYTGLNTNIGQRLRAIRSHVAGEDIFLANYGDNVTDAPLNELVDDFRRRDAVAAFLSVRPTQTFHVVQASADGAVLTLTNMRESDVRINGGYFILRREIFDYLGDGEELVEEPFRRLIDDGKLVTYQHDGFWAPMDTLKDLQLLSDLWETGDPPWAVWQQANGSGD